SGDERARRSTPGVSGHSSVSRGSGSLRRLRGVSRSGPPLVQDALDWLLLERRCCPFLRLELSFEPSNGPVWFRFRGGPGIKEFLAAAGFKASPLKNRP